MLESLVGFIPTGSVRLYRRQRSGNGIVGQARPGERIRIGYPRRGSKNEAFNQRWRARACKWRRESQEHAIMD